MYLRIANELYLKRLIVGGFDGVYEFSKDFRNEGMDRTHNPEFTVMELYVAYKDYNWMMDTTEQLLEKVALDAHGSTEIQVGDKKIEFKAPYPRIPILEAIEQHTGFDVSEMDEAQLRVQEGESSWTSFSRPWSRTTFNNPRSSSTTLKK